MKLLPLSLLLVLIVSLTAVALDATAVMASKSTKSTSYPTPKPVRTSKPSPYPSKTTAPTLKKPAVTPKPTTWPTLRSTTSRPTKKPTQTPTVKVTKKPTLKPTTQPTLNKPVLTNSPTSWPTVAPTSKPTKKSDTLRPTSPPTICTQQGSKDRCGRLGQCEWVSTAPCNYLVSPPKCTSYEYGCQEKASFCEFTRGNSLERQMQCNFKGFPCRWYASQDSCGPSTRAPTPPPSPHFACTNTCIPFNKNGICEDRTFCFPGTDCADCGPRWVP